MDVNNYTMKIVLGMDFFDVESTMGTATLDASGALTSSCMIFI